MNPLAASQPKAQSRSLFEGAFESSNEFEKAENVNTEVSYTEEHLKSFKNDWVELFSRNAENTKNSTSSVETTQKTVENRFVEVALKTAEERFRPDFKPTFVIENEKGSGSLLEETGIVTDIAEKAKGFAKNLLSVFSLFGEIFLDTVKLATGSQDKKTKSAEKPETDPEKARAKAEKKAENQKKQNNIRAFYDGLRAQVGSVATADAIRMDAQEKSNINLTAKIGQESYKGIKDSFGRLTIYASSMFEIAQLDQEKKAKKQEKEMKIASVGGKGPDLNMDKVAEGGFLSSTGGQGAG